MFLCTFVHIRTFCQAPLTIEMVLASAAKLSITEKQAGSWGGIGGASSWSKSCCWLPFFSITWCMRPTRYHLRLRTFLCSSSFQWLQMDFTDQHQSKKRPCWNITCTISHETYCITVYISNYIPALLRVEIQFALDEGIWGLDFQNETGKRKRPHSTVRQMRMALNTGQANPSYKNLQNHTLIWRTKSNFWQWHLGLSWLSYFFPFITGK